MMSYKYTGQEFREMRVEEGMMEYSDILASDLFWLEAVMLQD
jgi:hypothetical protein